MSSEPHTLYLDTTEEITAVIDRLGNVPGDVVELVIPVNAAVLQSVVNLKLLARAAKRLSKTLTITTRDETGQHLARQAGIAVRSQLGGPLLTAPQKPHRVATEATVHGTADDAPTSDEPTQPATPPARPAARSVAVTSTGRKLRALVETDADEGAPRSAKSITLLPDWPWKKLGIGVAVVVVVGFIVLTFPLASARIKVVPKQQQAALDLEVVVKPEPDASKHEVPGRILEQSREGTRQVAPSGSKETGTKATGTVTISNVFSNKPQSFGVGTRLQEPGGHVFLLTAQITVPGATVDKGTAVPGTVTSTVEAEKFGEDYNLGPTTFAFIDLPADQQTGISAKSDATMSGGTKKTVKVLSADDVAKAVKEIQDELTPQLTEAIKGQLVSGEELLDGATTTNVKGTTSSIKVDTETEAATVEVKATVVVKGFADQPASVEAVTAEALKGQLPANQSLLDSAPSTVRHTFKSVDFKQQTMVLSTHAERLAVYNVDINAVADQVAGKTRGQADEILKGWPEVDHVDVQLSPFWRIHLPGNSGRIKVELGT